MVARIMFLTCDLVDVVKVNGFDTAPAAAEA